MSQRKVSFGVAISQEVLGEGAPVPFQLGLVEGIEKAAELGFECVEIHIRNPRDLDVATLERATQASGVRIAAIGTGVEYVRNSLSLTADDPAVRAQAIERMCEHIELAARFDAVVFLGLIRGKCGTRARLPEYLDRLAQSLLPIARLAEEKGVATGLEPVAYYFSDLLNTTDETLSFLERPGLGSIGLLLDTHHIFLEDRSMEESLRKCAGRTTHFHISDSNRRYPGAGNIDFALVARTLTDIGYAGAVSLEILPAPSAEEAARKGIAWMRQAFGR